MVSGLIEFMHGAGSVICSRAHPLEGPVLLPVCARCTGLYLACALGILGPFAIRAMRGTPLVIAGRPSLAIAMILVGVTVAHALWAPGASDLGRLAAGAAGGVGIAILLGAQFLPAVATAAALVAFAATRSPAVFTILAFATPLAVLTILFSGAYRVAKRLLGNAASVESDSGTFFSDEREEAAPGGAAQS
jgi:hypothetical protein